MPTYYKNFKCKCSSCRHTCCHGWQIPISREEYFHLVSMECNPELRRHMDDSFIVPKDNISEERYRIISFNYFGDCPIQKDGLCSIHAELGENTLPKVCRLYPRSLKMINDMYFACCSSSCERIVEMLSEQDSLGLHPDILDAKPTLEYSLDASFKEELDHFNLLLQDKTVPLDKRIQKVCLEVNKEEFIKDYNIEENPLTEGLYILSRLVDNTSFLSEINEVINNRYKENYFQYEIDKEEFNNRFPNWQNIFANVINNSLLFENFPFVDNRFSKIKAYKGLCASYGLLRLVCIGYTSVNQSKEDLIDAISALFHLIDHTSFYYNIFVIADSAALLLKL